MLLLGNWLTFSCSGEPLGALRWVVLALSDWLPFSFFWPAGDVSSCALARGPSPSRDILTVTCTLAKFKIYLGLLYVYLQYLATLLQGLTEARLGVGGRKTRQSNKPVIVPSASHFSKLFQLFLQICYMSERKTRQQSPPSLTRGVGEDKHQAMETRL